MKIEDINKLVTESDATTIVNKTVIEAAKAAIEKAKLENRTAAAVKLIAEIERNLALSVAYLRAARKEEARYIAEVRRLDAANKSFSATGSVEAVAKAMFPKDEYQQKYFLDRYQSLRDSAVM